MPCGVEALREGEPPSTSEGNVGSVEAPACATFDKIVPLVFGALGRRRAGGIDAREPGAARTAGAGTRRIGKSARALCRRHLRDPSSTEKIRVISRFDRATRDLARVAFRSRDVAARVRACFAAAVQLLHEGCAVRERRARHRSRSARGRRGPTAATCCLPASISSNDEALSELLIFGDSRGKIYVVSSKGLNLINGSGTQAFCGAVARSRRR